MTPEPPRRACPARPSLLVGILLVLSAGDLAAALPTAAEAIELGPSFVELDPGMTGVRHSSVAWGDYDNDGDLDVLLTGQNIEDGRVTELYQNDGNGSFTESGVALPVVEYSSIVWGDYDNDGDLDFLLTGLGLPANGLKARVYRNDEQGSFTNIGAALTGVQKSSAAWGDYDNDGDLDILITGAATSGSITRIYQNDVGIFTDIGAVLPGVSESSVAWGDYDNDGDLDILLTGLDGGSGSGIAKVFENNGSGDFTDVQAGLTGVSESSAAWGDYDNDGDLDILLTGSDGASPLAKVYRNDGPGVFTDTFAALTGVRESSVAWGDYDNDGNLDILLTGSDGASPLAKVYRNAGAGTFTDIGAGLTGVMMSSVAWGDYDNDGDLDILLTGEDGTGSTITRLYTNQSAAPNTAPIAPSGLATKWVDKTVTFLWDSATDAETPTLGLSYNLRVGTTPGGSEISATMAAGATGYRRIPALGNTGQSPSWTLNVPLAPVYWSVQAVDGAFAGSTFAPEQVSIPPFAETDVILTGSFPAWGDFDSDGDLDLLLSRTDRTRLYRNDGEGTFVDIGVAFVGDFGFSAWGDYDNDGDLDVLLTGRISTERIAHVYRNDGGGTFTNIGAGLAGAYRSSGAWGDYDNDGDLDILIAGNVNSPTTTLYRNDGGDSFTDVAASLIGVDRSSVAWGDYDNDGDLDILLSGRDQVNPVTKVYRNDGHGGFADVAAGLPGVMTSSVAWGDYDSDGDLDILLSGSATSGGITRIYQNDGGTFIDIDAGLTGVDESSVAWGDYDNDGDLDILLSGALASGGITKIYRNDGGTFTDISAGLESGESYSAAWGDSDNDGDLDIFVGGVAKQYENTVPTPNTPPSAPTNLNASWSGPRVTFSWDPALDAETPGPGLSYNLRVGTIPGGFDVTAAMAENATGYRQIPALGNTNQTLSWTLTAPAFPLYWSVQAVDGAWAGSAFAAERNTTPSFPPFVEKDPGLTGVVASAVAWGDYDNDGDLDLILTGEDDGGSEVAKVYRNDGENTFTDIATTLTGVSEASVAWGDYDHDNDLDIVLTGRDAGGFGVAEVYRNDGGGLFTDIAVALPGVVTSSVVWGDYDNDGDLDLLLTGLDNSATKVAQLYRNDGGDTFADVGTALTGVDHSSVAWGDYDNDGDLDLLLTGLDSGSNAVTQVYRNDGGGAFTDIAALLTGVFDSAVAWGDYDSDGDLDILLTGSDGVSGTAEVYRNDGGGSFTDIGADLPGVLDSSVAWGDHNHDGSVDILLTGETDGGDRVARVYLYDGEDSFIDAGATLTGVRGSSVAWGDSDNDGDLDIILTGRSSTGGGVARLYESQFPIPNQVPTAPTELTAGWTGTSVVLSWSAGTDAETPAPGLSYNLRVGTTPGGSEISAAMADGASGYRYLPALGNTNQTLNWSLDLTSGPIYWSVQSVDATFAGSAFAPEQVTSHFLETDVGLEGVSCSSGAWGDYDNDGDLDILLAGDGGAGFVTSVYRNDGAGGFTDIETGLVRVACSSGAWGDYDNDGDLDILLTGIGGEQFRPTAEVYRNIGGDEFTWIPTSLDGVFFPSVAWGDYDNDGDLDILLTGWNQSGEDWITITRLYRNDGGGNFTDANAALAQVGDPSVAWGDYDNDGDLDILLAGGSAAGLVTKVYRNDEGVFADIAAGLPGVNGASVAWGDYDSDGDLDFILAGIDSSSTALTRVYRNDGADTFTDIAALLPEVFGSDVAWGDYDGDGDLDILLSGRDGDRILQARLSRNDGDGLFTDIDPGLTPIASGSVAWGDYDNDGDLDILLTGQTATGEGVTKLYTNQSLIPNTVPTSPTNLNAAWSADSTVTFSWDAATDAETAASGLSYNLRVGTTPGGSEVSSPMADTASGLRHIPALGNTNQSLSWSLGVTADALYWSVQAVDGAFAGSLFSSEQLTGSPTSSIPENDVRPTAFAFYTPRPTPFQSQVSFRFDLPSAENVRLVLYDAAGRQVRVLADALHAAGSHQAWWDGDDEQGDEVGPGIYFARLGSGSFVQAQRVVRIR